MGAPLGLDPQVEAANITGSGTGWRGRIEALLTALFGDANPFGTAASVGVGTASGDAVEIEATGRVPASVVPAGGVSGITDVATSVRYEREGPYIGGAELAVKVEGNTLVADLVLRRVAATTTGRPTVQTPDTPVTGAMILGLEESHGREAGSTITDAVTVTPSDAAWSVLMDNPNIATGSLSGTGSSRTVFWQFLKAGSTTGRITISNADGSGENVYAVSLTATQSTAVPRVTGIGASWTEPQGSVREDEIVVIPPQATVTVTTANSTIAQGDVRGVGVNRTILWTFLGIGQTTGTVTATNGNEESTYTVTLHGVTTGPPPSGSADYLWCPRVSRPARG